MPRPSTATNNAAMIADQLITFVQALLAMPKCSRVVVMTGSAPQYKTLLLTEIAKFRTWIKVHIMAAMASPQCETRLADTLSQLFL